MGCVFVVIIKFNVDKLLEFDFGQSNEGSDEEVDFSGQELVGFCFKCQSYVYENGMFYVCEKLVGVVKSCDFCLGKIILQQEIDCMQMKKLFDEGKIDLFKGFILNWIKCKFLVFLVCQFDGKIGFEFEFWLVKVVVKFVKVVVKVMFDVGVDVLMVEVKLVKVVKVIKIIKMVVKFKVVIKKIIIVKQFVFL